MIKNEKSKVAMLICIGLLGILAYSLGLSFFVYSWTPGPNYRNVTVDTKVNITGSTPTVLAAVLSNPITLSAGSLTLVTCNVSARDFNGFADISYVNATLFHVTSAESAADDNNTHYTNTSCSVIAGQQGGSYANYTCSFPVTYYALNGTWNCTARINDTTGLRGSLTNSTTISPLYALNITPTLIDYGNISSGTYSDNISVNITNLGDTLINISVYGYARNYSDNLSFVCDQGNLSIDLEHFSANLSGTTDWASKQNLSSTVSRAIAGLSINKTRNSTYMLNTTYWELYADPTQVAFGNCTGFVVFQAEAAN